MYFVPTYGPPNYTLARRLLQCPRPLTLDPLGEEIYAGDRTQRGPRRDRMRPRGFGGGPAVRPGTVCVHEARSRDTGSRTSLLQ